MPLESPAATHNNAASSEVPTEALTVAPLVITKHPGRHLMLFTKQEWQTFSSIINALPMAEERKKLMFLASRQEVEMDLESGRILISPELRAYAGLEKELVIAGMGKYFQIMSKAKHSAQEAQENELYESNPGAYWDSISY